MAKTAILCKMAPDKIIILYKASSDNQLLCAKADCWQNRYNVQTEFGQKWYPVFEASSKFTLNVITL
jgi:hypothetical protein